MKKKTREEFPDGIRSFGTDALRFTFSNLASPGRDISFDMSRCDGYGNFCNKLRNASRFVLMNCDDKDNGLSKCSGDCGPDGYLFFSIADRWIISRLQQSLKRIDEFLSKYRFDLASKELYEFVWNEFCDWYLELAKTQLISELENRKRATRRTMLRTFETILRLSHPFIPFITEELWLKNKLDKPKNNYLMFANWSNKKANKDKQIKEVENIINLISQLRAFKNELNVSPGSFVDMSISTLSKNDQLFIKKNQTVLKKLGRINSFLDTDKDKASANLVIKGDIFKIYFDQSIDLSLIKENLLKRQQKYQSELDGISKRLSNKSFVERAPKNIVDQEKNNYSNLKKDIDKISITIKGL